MPGNFTVGGMADNIVSTLVLPDQTISVYERIVDLVLYGNSSVLAPGPGVWVVAAGADQLPLENLICVWNMGTNYGYTSEYVAEVSASTSHQMTFSYATQEGAGTQTVSVECSNAVSSQNLTMSSQNLTMIVDVVWDNVTLGELFCINATWWNYSMSCQLQIVRFGSGACFEWDMGDGKPVVYYRDGYCAVDVTADSPTYVQVSSLATTRRLLTCFLSISNRLWPNYRQGRSV